MPKVQELGTPLNKQETGELTSALRSAVLGNDYDNPEVWGMISYLHDQGIPLKQRNCKADMYKADPAPYDAYVDEQVERFESCMEPFLGRFVVARSMRLAIPGEDHWQELQPELRSTAPYFVRGNIEGIDKQFVQVRASGRDTGQYRFGFNFRIGVVLDTSGQTPIYSHDRHSFVPEEHPDRVMVLPRTDPTFLPGSNTSNEQLATSN